MENREPKKVSGKKVREAGESGEGYAIEIKRKREHPGGVSNETESVLSQHNLVSAK